MGIAFKGRYLRSRLPDHQKLPDGKYLMVGWGDNKYYPSEDRSVWLLLRAALLPTGSVIHAVGFDGPVVEYFYQADIVRVRLSRKGMRKMASFIAGRFKKEEDGSLMYAADGLFPRSAFFKARGWYFFPKTSNTWTARALRKSGFPITPVYALTSGNVLQQTRKHGKVLQ